MKFKHLDLSVGKTLLLLLIKIKLIFSLGSSKTFSNALIEFKFNNSMLSIKTNLFLLLNEDLFRLTINSLIWFISMFFLSSATSIRLKFGLDLFCISLNDLFSKLILLFSTS